MYIPHNVGVDPLRCMNVQIHIHKTWVNLKIVLLQFASSVTHTHNHNAKITLYFSFHRPLERALFRTCEIRKDHCILTDT